MASYRVCVTVVDIHAGALCSLINSGDDVHVVQTIRKSMQTLTRNQAIDPFRFIIAKLARCHGTK